MLDIFDDKNISHMLIKEEVSPFDSKDYLYEIKFDGIRGWAYLDENGTDLRNKKNKNINNIFPELIILHKQIKKKCIIDGEIVVLDNGKPDFSEVQRRTTMSDKYKISLFAQRNPAHFLAFDIVYLDDTKISNKLLIERKEILQSNIIENPHISISRYIYERGTDFYNLVKEQDLEGIVAKRIDSLYHFGKRTSDWKKIKNQIDEDFIICGYLKTHDNMNSLILGLYYNGKIIRQGHVSLGVTKYTMSEVRKVSKIQTPLFNNSADNNAIWIEPKIVCTVRYMFRSSQYSLRQPVFKGFVEDKEPEECILKS